MKRLLSILAATTVLASLAATAQAQSIAWGSAIDTSSSSDVLNNGTYFDAATFGTAATVNGVAFNKINDGIISATNPGGATGANPLSADPAYNDITNTIGFGYQIGGEVTISGLTLGQEYQVQAWSWWYSGFSAGLTTLTGSTPVAIDAGIGQFAVGMFTATSSTETFNYDPKVNPGGDSYGNYAMLDAVSVTAISNIPEPSTWAMMVGGLGMLFAGQRIRRSSR